MQADLINLIGNLISKKILTCSEFESSGNMRWQHVGVFWGIYYAQKSGIQVTTNYLVNISKTRRTSILDIAKNLERIGLIKHRVILPKHGKGREFEFFTELSSETANALILEALGDGISPTS